jgi:hypothetical protein
MRVKFKICFKFGLKIKKNPAGHVEKSWRLS